MARFNRKTTPKVKDGKVQRKNRSALTPNYWSTSYDGVVIDKESPGSGHKHFLRKRDVTAFLEIIPEWERLSDGLEAILLAEREAGMDGWYAKRVIGICAWPKAQWIETAEWYYKAHRRVFARLGVPCEPAGRDVVRCKFRPETIRAFQLLHIFLHELGHHHDRMTTRSQRQSARGEGFAESYALIQEKVIWDRYRQTFDV